MLTEDRSLFQGSLAAGVLSEPQRLSLKMQKIVPESYYISTKIVV
jgi:hypothetical protein